MVDGLPNPDKFADVDDTLAQLGLDVAEGIDQPEVARFISMLFDEEGEE